VPQSGKKLADDAHLLRFVTGFDLSFHPSASKHVGQVAKATRMHIPSAFRFAARPWECYGSQMIARCASGGPDRS
jgi:hypothetical protein